MKIEREIGPRGETVGHIILTAEENSTLDSVIAEIKDIYECHNLSSKLDSQRLEWALLATLQWDGIEALKKEPQNHEMHVINMKGT